MMGKAYGKQFCDYSKTDRAKTYFAALSTTISIPVLQTTKGSPMLIHTSLAGCHRGTYIHPRIAMDYARWLDPHFAVWIDSWCMEVFSHLPSSCMTQPKIKHHILKRRALHRKQSNLYIMAMKDRYGKYKVGMTRNTKKRLIQLGRLSYPPDEQPSFIRVWKGKGSLERNVHSKCDAYRLGKSEWFEIELDQLIPIVESVIADDEDEQPLTQLLQC
jgi:hypothetical protein